MQYDDLAARVDDFVPPDVPPPLAAAAPAARPPRPRAEPDWWRFVVDHNPLFLLSAASMLLGCRLLDESMDRKPDEIGKLAGLIGTVTAYELLLIGLGALLIVTSRQRRDGRLLIGLEFLFLCDLAFLNAELLTAGRGVGGALAVGALILLVAAKVVAIARVPGFHPRPGVLATSVAALAALYATPYALAVIDRHTGSLPDYWLYGAWWVAGALVVLATALIRPLDGPSSPAGRAETPWQRWVTALFVALPIASLVLHLSLAHYVYKIEFAMAHVSPLLLGLTVAAPRLMPQTGRVPTVGFPLLAVLLSLDANSDLSMLGDSVTPARLTLLGAAAVTAWLAWRSASPMALIGAGAYAAFALTGSTPQESGRNVGQLAEWGTASAGELLPRSGVGWGVVAVVVAFALLGVGMLVSWRKQPGKGFDVIT